MDFELFIAGVIGYHVTNDEQSQLLINTAKDAGFIVDDFSVDTYATYQYYYIEDGWQLQASADESEAMESVEEIAVFFE